MSKCIESLKRTAAPAVASIGFQPRSTEQKKAALIVIGTITSGVKKNVKAISSAGLDAVLFRPSVKTDLSEVMDSIGSVPFGLYLDDTQKEYDLPDNLDFLVYSTKMPVSMLNKCKAGKILEIDPLMDLGSVRAINGTASSIDAVILRTENASVTVETLLHCRRVSELVAQPLIVPVSPSAGRDELLALCEAGADGILINGAGSSTEYAAIMKVVAGLPAKTKRKENSLALVPRIGGMSSADDDEQEDDE